MVRHCLRLFAQLVLIAFALPALATPDMLAEAELDTPQAHVQQQVVYRLRFLHAVDVRSVQLVGPSARLSNLHPIGEVRVYEAQRGNKRYRVHERRYAVFPFASGPLELSGAYVNGLTPSASPTGQRPVRIDFPARVLHVLPPPNEQGEPWLPARKLDLSEQWETLKDNAYRRTIRIEAAGVEVAQLPELRLNIPGMEVLRGTRRLTSRFDGDRAIATSEQSFLLSPSREGEIHVPPLPLTWWNPDTAAPVFVNLPARTLFAGRLNVPANTASATSAEGSRMTALIAPLTAIIAGASLLLLLAYRYRARLRCNWNLRRAMMAGDARGVRDGLLAWAACRSGDAPLTLAALAERMHDEAARDAVHAFERSLYGPPDGSWRREKLSAVVTACKRAAPLARSH